MQHILNKQEEFKKLVQYYLKYKFQELKGKSLRSLNWVFGGFNELGGTGRGYCDTNSKEIIIGYESFLDEGIDDEQCKEIVLHEIAHAIEFELYGNSNHDKRYEQICKSIGHQTGVSGYMIYSDNNSITASGIDNSAAKLYAQIMKEGEI